MIRRIALLIFAAAFLAAGQTARSAVQEQVVFHKRLHGDTRFVVVRRPQRYAELVLRGGVIYKPLDGEATAKWVVGGTRIEMYLESGDGSPRKLIDTLERPMETGDRASDYKVLDAAAVDADAVMVIFGASNRVVARIYPRSLEREKRYQTVAMLLNDNQPVASAMIRSYPADDANRRFAVTVTSRVSENRTVEFRFVFALDPRTKAFRWTRPNAKPENRDNLPVYGPAVKPPAPGAAETGSPDAPYGAARVPEPSAQRHP